MDINLDLIKRIISSDELCDKVNSSSYKESYKNQIRKYVLFLVDDLKNNNTNITYINRYLRKFVVTSNLSKEEKFFDPVLLKSYSLNINDTEFLNILTSINFNEVKELLMKKYDQFVKNFSYIDNKILKRMLLFYYYACNNYVLPNNYINYLITHIINNKFVFDYDLICYFYKEFTLSFSLNKGININFVISEGVVGDDPYYDNKKNKVIIYKKNITNELDYNILASIFYQIKHAYLLKSINDIDNSSYNFEQLRLVKEICLISILGEEYFKSNYGNISFTSELRRESFNTVRNYFNKLNIKCDIDIDIDDIVLDNNIDEKLDKTISIDILFDQVINREGANLLKSLIKNYPILGCEYKIDKKKSLLNLLTDIYSNRKLLITLNKDLQWHSNKINSDNEIIKSKIDRLNKKISICSSCINVMNLIINSGDMTSSDVIRSISDLILYDTNKKYVQNDIYSILLVVIPRKIERLCTDRNSIYIEDFRKKVVECYLKSLNTVRNNMDMDYFMRLYSTLENINQVFSKQKL